MKIIIREVLDEELIGGQSWTKMIYFLVVSGVILVVVSSIFIFNTYSEEPIQEGTMNGVPMSEWEAKQRADTQRRYDYQLAQAVAEEKERIVNCMQECGCE